MGNKLTRAQQLRSLAQPVLSIRMQMGAGRLGIIFSLFALMACERSVDADTVMRPENTSPFGNGTVTMVVGNERERLREPTYLPEWAPRYPGSVVTSKLVQRDAQGVIGRGTELSTTDSFEQVASFYAAAVTKAGWQAKAAASGGMVEYSFDNAKGYHSGLLIKQIGPRVQISIAQTASS